VPDERGQDTELNDPDPDGVSLNETTPLGVIAIPGLVSEIVTAQVEPWLTDTEDGEHVTDVDVAL
jgi:hypothetical protein